MSNTLSEQNRRISELEKRLENICRLAQVHYVYRKIGDPGIAAHDDGTKIGRVDIIFEGHILLEIPFLTFRQGEDSTFWLPSAGELGVLQSPSGDLANAFFMPGIAYSGFPAEFPTDDTPAVAVSKRIFRDGTEEVINTDAHSYELRVPDSDAAKIKIDADETRIERTAGKIVAEVGSGTVEVENGKATLTVGTTELEVSATQIKGSIAGVGKLLVTAALVNVNGATFLGGTTNLLGAAPVTYPPVPIV